MFRSTHAIGRPAASEYPEWAHAEIAEVVYDDLIVGLQEVLQESLQVLRPLSEQTLQHRYEPGKWSIKEVWQHVIDVERVFGYRAMRYSRNDKTVLSRLDTELFSVEGMADYRNWPDMLEEYAALRRASMLLFASFTVDMLSRRGTAGKSEMTVRAVGYLLLGHNVHHLKIIRERYLSVYDVGR